MGRFNEDEFLKWNLNLNYWRLRIKIKNWILMRYKFETEFNNFN